MASPENKNLARQLIALQIAHSDAAAARINAAVQVVDELSLRLVRLSGVDGFRALLSRALSLARAETTSLHTVYMRADGSLGGFDDMDDGQKAGAAGEVLVAHLLELLVTFIGESLTLVLVRDVWPGGASSEVDLRTEGKQ